MPDIQFKRQWFGNIPKYGKSYWKRDVNHREFLVSVSCHLNIGMTDNWNRVSSSIVKKLGGQVDY